MIIELRPSEIYYSQDSISCFFKTTNRRIGKTLDDLFLDRLSVSDFKRISVAVVNGRYVTWDNRRLWVFRHLEKLGKCDFIFVNRRTSIEQSRLTTKCEGREVTVRGDPGGMCYKYLEQIEGRSSGEFVPESIPPNKRSSHKTYRANSESENDCWNESLSRNYTSSNDRYEPLHYRRTLPPDTKPDTTGSFLGSLRDVALIGIGLAAMYLFWKST